MVKPEAKPSNEANNDDSSWLSPIELRIFSVQKETACLQKSNRELSRRLSLLRSRATKKPSNQTKPSESTVTPLAQV